MSTRHISPAQEATTTPSGATRHLCAGVYVNEQFRDFVVNEVCTSPYRRVAPSYGFDLVPVMRHAWWATHLSVAPRLVIIAAVATPAIVGNWVTAMVVICGLVLLWMLGHACILLAESTRQNHQGTTRKSAKRRAVRGWKRTEAAQELRRLGRYASAVSIVTLILAALHPEQAKHALYLGGAIALSLLAVGALRQLRLDRIHRATSLRPRRVSRREQVVEEQQEHACVVYRRPQHSDDEDDDLTTLVTLFDEESPFIGAGKLIYQWNPPMSVQLLRPGNADAPLHEREHSKPPFKAHELVEHLREAVRDLQTDSEDVRLPVEIRDRVYVAETDVSINRDLLGRRIDSTDTMRDIINGQNSKQHHFLEVSTPVDGSEFIATVLLQTKLQGRNLRLSSAACVLTRTPHKFQQVEEFGQHGAGAIVWAAFRELLSLPREIAQTWRIIRYPYVLAKALVLPHDLTLSPIRNVAIGTRVSVREKHVQEWNKVQLEKTELLGRIKSIEQRLLAAASDFLHSKDVDTSEFNNRAQQIINSSIVNIGDNNNVSNNAIGDGARSNDPGNQNNQAPMNSGGRQ